MGWALLLLLAGQAGTSSAEPLTEEQILSFSEVETRNHRIVCAIIEVPAEAASTLKAADVELTAACPEAMGELTLSAASLWEALPGDWALALDPAGGMTGLFFQAEGENAFHAEIGKLLMDWTGAPSVFLVLAFDCEEVDCACAPLIAAGALRLIEMATEEP
jgi:hypothetical protein